MRVFVEVLVVFICDYLDLSKKHSKWVLNIYLLLMALSSSS